MSGQALLVAFVASIGLAVTPGPNSLLAVSHGALHGHRRTLFTILGGSAGFTLIIALSMFGVGALLQASADALLVMKLVGGAYLAWLGVQLWRAPPVTLDAVATETRAPGRLLFRQGLLTALSNPKALLFYGAFLPQFLDPARPLAPQFAALLAIFVLVEIVAEYLMALTAHRVRAWLERAGRRFNRVCGGMFVAMGVALPISR